MIRDFQSWLARHSNELPTPIESIGRRGNYHVFRFVGIKSLEIDVIERGVFEVSVYYKRDCVDILIDFDIYPEKNSSGRYFCSECHGKQRSYFQSKERLFEEHTFDPFLQWCKENLRPGKKLVMWREDGISTAQIVDRNKRLMENLKYKYFVEEYPIPGGTLRRQS